MLFEWSVSDAYPDSFWLEYDDEASPDALTFHEGRRLRRPRKPIVFRASAKVSIERLRTYDVLMGDMTDLVSDRFRRLIERVAPNDCQFFPAEVRAGAKTITGYYLRNVAVRRPMIDLAKSRFKPAIAGEAGPPYDFKKRVFRSQALGPHHVARAEEDLELVVVSEPFARECRNAQIRGADFEPLAK